MRVEVQDIIKDREEWQLFIDNHPDGNFFQTPIIFEFYKEQKELQPFIFKCYSEKNELLGLMLVNIQSNGPKVYSFLTQRAIIIGGPLIKDQNKEVLESILTEYDFVIKKRVVYSEIRNLFDCFNYKEIFKAREFLFTEHLNFIVKLGDINDVLKRISKTKLRQIRSAKKNGAKIEEVTKIEEVVDFYKILRNLYSKKVKKPLPRLDFFIHFYNLTQKENSIGKIFVVKKQNVVIGGIVCPIFNNKIIYEWYVAGDDINNRDLYPSILATYAPIEYGIIDNLESFDFMGAGSPNQKYGVRDFKSKFGGTMVEFGRFKKVHKPIVYYISKQAIKIWSLI